MCLAFTSCGYIAKKQWVWQLLPALCLLCQLAWASLALTQWSVVRQVWPKRSVLCDHAKTVFAHRTAHRADPKRDLCSAHGMLFKYWAVLSCSVVSNQAKTLSNTGILLLAEEVGSGEHNTSSQKYFHILQQFTLQQLSQLWYLFIERIYPVISTSSCRSDLHHTSLLRFKTATGCFLLTSSSSTHRDHTLPVQWPCPAPDFVDLCKVSVLRKVSRG